jgi:hypothetical protein
LVIWGWVVQTGHRGGIEPARREAGARRGGSRQRDGRYDFYRLSGGVIDVNGCQKGDRPGETGGGSSPALSGT